MPIFVFPYENPRLSGKNALIFSSHPLCLPFASSHPLCLPTLHLSSVGRVVLRHTSRETRELADRLAKAGTPPAAYCMISDFLFVYSLAPLINFIEKDKQTRAEFLNDKQIFNRNTWRLGGVVLLNANVGCRLGVHKKSPSFSHWTFSSHPIWDGEWTVKMIWVWPLISSP